ncbi:phage tail protein [Sodalis ligni]|uniref:Uncharacterized protein n=1 Tax=Sodalis ligni TaxID=2697027 RepID=A0A4R1N9W2_9GAMM|nr:phage tail protein [Sodalis ligni]TCL04073.1 hypothetical protein EZJ58_2175 [Sodalis ligni]
MADRAIVYLGSIPLETDILSTNKFSIIGLTKLAAAIMESNTYFNGLACTPTSPESLTVNIAPGEIYSLQNVDGTAYSSISADTTHSILKQGILMDVVTFMMTAPITSGMSVNYLIQVAYQDTDSNAVALPYYNSANPTQAWSGPNNSGATQNTVRSGVCTVALKTGVTATTGTQVTPAADTGYVGVYVITVAYGQATITTVNISHASNAPFLPSNGLVAGIQSGALLYAADTGTANVYAAAYYPAITALTDGVKVVFKAKTSNAGTSTFSPNGLTAYPIYSHAHQALQGGEIIANGLIEVEWNSTLTAWVLCGNSGGSTPVLAGTQTNHAVNLGQLNAISGRYITTQQFLTTGTYTRSTGANKVHIRLWGAGASGTGSSVAGTGASSGAAGGFIEGWFDISALSTMAIVIGAGVTAIPANSSATGISGGTSTIASLGLTANGGSSLAGGSAVSSLYSAIILLQGQGSQGAQTTSLGGNGGSSFSTYGGLPHSNGSGGQGGFPGSGGAGASNPYASGAGADGYCVIEEYTRWRFMRWLKAEL